MPSLNQELTSAADALRLGWNYVNTYPQQDQIANLHGRFCFHGYEVVDLPFDDKGDLVPTGSDALWVKMSLESPLAKCGCVYHAAGGYPCEHDIALVLGN
jgi:hypothetical protein